jgi:hypothetical protein
MNIQKPANEGDIILKNGRYFVFENNRWVNYSKFRLISKLKLPIYLNLLSQYKLKNNTFEVNLNESKEFQLYRFREARTPLLQNLDIEYMKADEQNNIELKQQIAEKKQALRDVTDIQLPDTLQELNDFWPEILN